MPLFRITVFLQSLSLSGFVLAAFMFSIARADDFLHDDDYNRQLVAQSKFYGADKTRDGKLNPDDGESWKRYQHLDNNGDGVVEFEEFKVGFELPLPDFGGKAFRNVVYKKADGRVLLMDIHQAAAAASPSPVLYYSHGGGWSGGLKEASGDTLEVCKRLSERGFTVVMVSYRLVREWDENDSVTMRDCVVDCCDGLRFLKKHESTLGIDMQRVAVFGSSAGGHLAQLMTFSRPDAFRGEAELDSFRVQPAAGVSWFGPSDFREAALFEFNGPGKKLAVDQWSKKITKQPSFSYENETPEVRNTTDRLSPVWWLSGQSAPLMHVHGDRDSVIPPQHGTHLAEAAKRVGAPVEVQIVEGAGHGWWAKNIVPSRQEIIEKTVDFIVANTER